MWHLSASLLQECRVCFMGLVLAFPQFSHFFLFLQSLAVAFACISFRSYIVYQFMLFIFGSFMHFCYVPVRILNCVQRPIATCTGASPVVLVMCTHQVVLSAMRTSITVKWVLRGNCWLAPLVSFSLSSFCRTESDYVSNSSATNTMLPITVTENTVACLWQVLEHARSTSYRRHITYRYGAQLT